MGSTSGTKAHEQGGSSTTQTTYNLGVSASWEVDLWGNIRHAIETSQAQLQAEESTLNAARLSAQASLASTYLTLRVLDQQLEHKRQSVALLQETHRITQHQYQAGLTTLADVALAESTLKTAEVSQTALQLSRNQLENALAVHIGQAPSQFSLPSQHPPSTPPRLPQMPAGVPSSLLERRPDIVKAEHLMAQANAKIGIARAAYFPTLTISASGAYKSNSFSNWINLPNRMWAIGPSLALSLFDAGLRRAKTEQAIAAYDQALANYRSTILSALQSVEDNLVAQNLLQQEATLQEQALQAAQQAERIVLNQYQAGTVAYLQVLNAQNTRLTAENNVWNIRSQQYASSVALITALGGWWSTNPVID
jgi:NodT family efflux transporter outer membrane factor (OMF) lipoprotein